MKIDDLRVGRDEGMLESLMSNVRFRARVVKEDAEDAVQIASIEVLERRRGEDHESLGGFLFNIAWKRAMNMSQRNSRLAGKDTTINVLDRATLEWQDHDKEHPTIDSVRMAEGLSVEPPHLKGGAFEGEPHQDILLALSEGFTTQQVAVLTGIDRPAIQLIRRDWGRRNGPETT